MADPCVHEGRLAVLEQNTLALQAGLGRFDEKLDQILSQLNKVPVLEAHHGHQNDALSRAFSRIESLETSTKMLSEFMNRTKGMAQMAYVMWGALGAGLFMLGVKVLFFMGAHGVTA